MPPSHEPDRGGSIRRALRWAIAIAAVVATAVVFVSVDSHSHSVSDTFYGMVVPEAIVLAAVALAWLVVGRWSAEA